MIYEHASDAEKYCVFRQAASTFALPAVSVVEVSPGAAVVPIPNSDPVLAGIGHLRNEFLPVLEWGAVTGEHGTLNQSQKQLLVVQGANGPWAIQVDRVLGLESLEISNGQDVHHTDDWTSAVIGSATLRSQVTRILNPTALYRVAEETLRRSWESTLPRPMECEPSEPPGPDGISPGTLVGSVCEEF